MPAEVKVKPSKLVMALFKVVAVSPFAIVTLSWKVSAPAALFAVIPEAVASVLAKVLVPALLMVIAAPLPVPIGVMEPTAPLKLVAPFTFKVRFCAPSSLASTVKLGELVASVKVKVTGLLVRFT